MFILKRTHIEKIRILESQVRSYESVVSQYEDRIHDLKDQIQDLRQLVFPKANSQSISKDAREVDAVLSASEKPVELSEEQMNLILEGQRELDLITSGNYAEDLLQ